MTGAPGTIVVHLGTGSGTFGPYRRVGAGAQGTCSTSISTETANRMWWQSSSGNAAAVVGRRERRLRQRLWVQPRRAIRRLCGGRLQQRRQKRCGCGENQRLRAVNLAAVEHRDELRAAARHLHVGPTVQDLRVGDVNGDAKLDVVALVNEQGALTFLAIGKPDSRADPEPNRRTRIRLRARRHEQ